MAFLARFAEEKCVVENDLTEPGHGIVHTWFEVFVEDTESGERYPLENGKTDSEAELALLMQRAAGVAQSMTDTQAIARQLGRAPVYSNAIIEAPEISDIKANGDDEVSF